jgi:nitroreductase
MPMPRDLPARPAPTSVPIDPLLARRWSPRALDPARAVTRAELATLLEAARWAPSSGNSQPWRFLVWDRDRDETGWQRAFATLEDGNREWVQRARLLIAVCADGLDRKGNPNRFAGHDAGLATQNLLLQAAALGLAAHPMAGYDAVALREVAAIPDRFQPFALIAVGRYGDPTLLAARHQAKESGPRERRALGESAFEGSWGQAFE